VARDPACAGEHYLVLCEVLNADGTEHVSNARGELRALLASGAEVHDAWIGFEQQYMLMRDGRALGLPNDGYPAAQESHYCNVGAGRVFGRDIAETHARLCEAAGLMICGLNAEVLPGQWEFQIGYRDRRAEVPSLLNASDHLWLARYLLHRVAERAGVQVSFQCNPVEGEWRGSSLHANFSSAAMRAEGGIGAIYAAIEPLAHAHERHVAVYGDRFNGNSSGQHESCSIFEFKAGGADRGASIRIPLDVELKGSGYFQDRRPSAHADPYKVAARLAATVFGIDERMPAGLRPASAMLSLPRDGRSTWRI
jgi:glutamine synthetase